MNKSNEPIVAGRPELSSGQHVYHHYDSAPDQIKVKLEKGQKGTYGWEITATGADVAEVMEKLCAANEELRRTFGAEA